MEIKSYWRWSSLSPCFFLICLRSCLFKFAPNSHSHIPTMAKGKQTAVKRKRGDKDAEQSPVVSKRPILQVSTGVNIPAGRHSSENGHGDSDNEDSAMSSAGDEKQREAFEKLKQQNEALLKANDQLKQDRLGLRKEQNRAQGGCILADPIFFLINPAHVSPACCSTCDQMKSIISRMSWPSHARRKLGWPSKGQLSLRNAVSISGSPLLRSC